MEDPSTAAAANPFVLWNASPLTNTNIANVLDASLARTGSRLEVLKVPGNLGESGARKTVTTCANVAQRISAWVRIPVVLPNCYVYLQVGNVNISSRTMGVTHTNWFEMSLTVTPSTPSVYVMVDIFCSTAGVYGPTAYVDDVSVSLVTAVPTAVQTVV